MGADHCVTGHTLDDQAETLLLRLARGTGLRGAAAMALDAPFPLGCPEAGELRLLRPLLELSRGDVLGYLEALELTPRLDPTNEDVTIDRNRVRHRVIPELAALNPDVATHLARFASLARSDDEALEGWARREFERIGSWGAGTARLDRRQLLELPAAVGSRVVRVAGGAIGIEFGGAQIDAVLGIAARRGARISLAGAEARTIGEELLIARLPDSQQSGGAEA
jgi:tRNA(Ile)-lysidine synthase